MPVTLYCSKCGRYVVPTSYADDRPSGECPVCSEALSRETSDGPKEVFVGSIHLPFLWIFGPPIVAAGLYFLLIMFRIGLANWLSGTVMLIGFGFCIASARRVARHLTERPTGSPPSISSTTLTILFAILFAFLQVVVAVSLVFFGCVVILMTLNTGDFR